MFKDKLKDTQDRISRSLNFFQRKKENDRIERENLKFAKRLLEKPGALDLNGMTQSFEQHMRYRKLLLRVPHKM